jgi:hypothetical protein
VSGSIDDHPVNRVVFPEPPALEGHGADELLPPIAVINDRDRIPPSAGMGGVVRMFLGPPGKETETSVGSWATSIR